MSTKPTTGIRPIAGLTFANEVSVQWAMPAPSAIMRMIRSGGSSGGRGVIAHPAANVIPTKSPVSERLIPNIPPCESAAPNPGADRTTKLTAFHDEDSTYR